ncbi:hypothetical protein N8T08_002214 [Aspergillus melleus]|uniref:Uncharacterized protein n=1 Tax=Aspergillus melleus TaxID=138277 RepID=A0ACC3B939_9EURO|nr:hypothetical protein N8T08_002214 [Aspergillus melleus]
MISAPLAVGAGTMMDMWTGVNTNRGVVLIMAIAFLGPAVGELVGGWVAQFLKWQWSQWLSLGLGAGLWIFAMGAQETYAGPVMRRKAKKLGLPIPPSPIPPGLADARFLVTVTLAKPLYMLIREPIVLLCSLYSSLNFSVLFCFLAAIPLIYSDAYGFTPGESGLVLIGITVGCSLGGMTIVLLDSYTLKRHVRKRGAEAPPPERMLWGAMIGGRYVLQVSTMLYLTNVYGARFGASALAANGLLRYLVGGSFPLFTIPSGYTRLFPSIHASI